MAENIANGGIFKFVLRHGSPDEWDASSTVLAEGEPGVAVDPADPNRTVVRVGDGLRAWPDLPDVAGGLASILQQAKDYADSLLGDVTAPAWKGVQVAAGVHLDTITAPGPWYQPYSANATLDLGYPVEAGGAGMNLNWDNGDGSPSVFRVYYPYGRTSFFVQQIYNGALGPWREFKSAADFSAEITKLGADTLRDAKDHADAQDDAHSTADRAYTDAQLAAAAEYVGQIANLGTNDLNTFTGNPNDGKARRFLYYINVGTAVLNMPPGPGSGFLEVRVSPNAANYVQTVTYTRTPAESWHRYGLLGTNGVWTWGAWERFGTDAEYRGQILNVNTEDLNTYRPTTGGAHRRYWLNGGSVLNVPGDEPWSGLFEVFTSQNVKTWLQRVTYAKASPEVWERRILDGTGGIVFDPWVRIDKGGISEKAAPQREALVSAFKARRGGRLGTAGRAVVSLRFDHGLTNFETKVLPLLRKYSLPAMQTMNARTWGQAANSGMTAAELQSAWLNDGVEVTAHGATHNDGATDAAVRDEIVNGLAELQAAFPESLIEGYCPPGVTGTRFQGFDGGDTLAKWYDTLAGRLILQHHAAPFGYLGGIYRPQAGDITVGASHTTIDASTVADVQAIIRGNNSAGGALTLMLHPVYLDTAGYMTTAGLESVLSYIAGFRDSGTLEVLTPTGAMLADPSTTYRHDLITDGHLRDGLALWGNNTGWTTSETNGVTWATTTTGTALTRTVSLSRLAHLRGSARELAYTAVAPAGAVVDVTVTNGSKLNATRQVTLPASANPVTVRTPFSIPTVDGTGITVSIGRVSGGEVRLTDVHARTI